MKTKPTLLTPETSSAILMAIRAGNFRATACALAGVHRSTVAKWEARGEAGEEPYATFAHELEVAEAEGESALLARVTVDNPAWVLERRWPKKYCLRVRAHVADELESLISKLQARLPADTFKAVLDASREDAPGESPGVAQH